MGEWSWSATPHMSGGFATELDDARLLGGTVAASRGADVPDVLLANERQRLQTGPLAGAVRMAAQPVLGRR